MGDHVDVLELLLQSVRHLFTLIFNRILMCRDPTLMHVIF